MSDAARNSSSMADDQPADTLDSICDASLGATLHRGRGWRVLHGDCVATMAKLPDASVDAIITDPPYGLEFMGKDWDAPWKQLGDAIEDPASVGGFQDGAGGNPFSRSRIRYGAGNGFQAWCETWAAEAMRILKPGGYLLSFGGTRTYHRPACAIEDVGFEIRDTLDWWYGSGFPKSLDVSKAIDAKLGVVGKVVGTRTDGVGNTEESIHKTEGFAASREKVFQVTVSASWAARAWDGWGTALKPAHEPIIVARKPLVGTVAENALIHGTGGLNIDACRVDGAGAEDGRLRHGGGAPSDNIRQLDPEKRNEMPAGRWPPNLLLTHDPNCVQIGTREVKSNNFQGGGPRVNAVYGADVRERAPVGYAENGHEQIPAYQCVDGCPVAELDRQSGDLTSGSMAAGTYAGKKGDIYAPDAGRPLASDIEGSTGGASRFFPTFTYAVEDEPGFLYTAKPARAERDVGLDDLEAKTGGEATDRVDGSAGLNSPRAGAGRKGGRRNIHPTVKPVALMEWLVRLVTRPDAVVLDPFLGSGTTGCAAVRLGRQFIGIERDEGYVRIAERRIALAYNAPRSKPLATLERAPAAHKDQLSFLPDPKPPEPT